MSDIGDAAKGAFLGKMEADLAARFPYLRASWAQTSTGHLILVLQEEGWEHRYAFSLAELALAKYNVADVKVTEVANSVIAAYKADIERAIHKYVPDAIIEWEAVFPNLDGYIGMVVVRLKDRGAAATVRERDIAGKGHIEYIARTIAQRLEVAIPKQEDPLARFKNSAGMMPEAM